MFHVSTMLPYSEENKQQVDLHSSPHLISTGFVCQYFHFTSAHHLSKNALCMICVFEWFTPLQLERKRHIGNDIVVIIFVDGEDEKAREAALQFSPSCIKSHFNHIFALVSYNHDKNAYHLVTYSNKNVPEFGPPLPPSGEFTNHQGFRDFLLTKRKKCHIY